eukprot:CAMPEP_0174949852 /NCGR_PEP_ID=MMETSP1355-20121228/92598_1 /TAXON_ID=464990 /ORGANISM="Hemiselmis tepida, Strain CCMP443" /LENGTH=52 /DNA_ID=CAMNT_0016197431 /DNA_START=216 /DNA_END=374 /DNA_ORIENTATION=-
MLKRVLANLRQAARRTTFQRISERFADQGRSGLGRGTGSAFKAPDQRNQADG